MLNLKNKIDSNRLLPIFNLSKIKVYHEEVNLSNQPDYDISSYDGFADKEYPLYENINLSDVYLYLFDAELDTTKIRVPDIAESFDLENAKYFIQKLNKRDRSVEFKGTLMGNSFDIGSEHYETIATLTLIGLKSTDADELDIYQELLLEGYLLELEKNYKMSFFTFFTAIDSFVNDELSALKNTTFTELHDEIKYLSLKDKIRMLVKSSLGTDDLNSSKMWSTFSSLIKKLADIRDHIAHGKHHKKITEEMVSECFLLMAILVCIIKHKIYDFREMKKYLCD